MLASAIVVLLLVLLATGVPVGFSLAIAGAVGLLAFGGVGLLGGILSTTPLSTVNSYELISIPMFILMAEFVILSGIADHLFKAASAWVGRVPGGLGIATALSGAGFGAISGSSTAAAATLSATSIPAMLGRGDRPGSLLAVELESLLDGEVGLALECLHRKGHALAVTLLEAVVDRERRVEPALGDRVVELVAVALEFVDVGLQEVAAVAVERLHVAVEDDRRDRVVDRRLPVM